MRARNDAKVCQATIALARSGEMAAGEHEPMSDPDIQAPQKADGERGLLDLTVELSTKEITAGNEFAVFVLVKNPFTRPVWVERVHVSLPSELELANQHDMKIRRRTTALHKMLRRIGVKPRTKTRDDLEVGNEQTVPSQIDIRGGAKVEGLRMASALTQVVIRDEATVYGVEIVDPRAGPDSASRRVDLRSSLPSNAALQPSSTAVYTATFNVARSLTFAPSRYRLQFSVNYSFNAPMLDEVRQTRTFEALSTNTAAQEISIRPSLRSIITGGAIGGAVGSAARLLRFPDKLNDPTSLFTFGLAIILSAIAIIFIARKSEAQAFVTVEDFWGGLLIGFFVGYTGTDYFEELTKK
jgi:hypothetical protein